MKRYFLLVMFIIYIGDVSAQKQEEQQSVLKLSQEQLEALFLDQNLELIATKLNVDIADAAIAQAKLWENPSIEIGDFNLWSTSAQREGQVIPPLFGSFGRNTQFSVALNQLIQTAGKRGKLVNMQTVSKDIAIHQFEDVLRGLKVELRKSTCELIYLDSYRQVLLTQVQSLSKLIEAYTAQVANGNLSRSELLRLQSELFEVESELNDTDTEINGLQTTLKSLLNINSNVQIEVVGNNLALNPDKILLTNLIDTASENRPDVSVNKAQSLYYNKTLAYERSQSVPDITLGTVYDRRGSVWRDFVGFSVGLDIPIFNRNQGSIRSAQLGLQQSDILLQQQQNIARNEVTEGYQNYVASYNFYEKIKDNPLMKELDAMLDVYAKNLLNKNIGMVEYIDFMEAYKSNKQTFLSAQKNVSIKFEELQYVVGTDIK